MLIIAVTDTEEAVRAVQGLWLEYWQALGFSGEFQGFDVELQRLPGEYAAPRGRLGLAYIDRLAAGTIALRPLSEEACELKRLYVRPAFRRQGIARALLEWSLDQARRLGYRNVYGDTMPVMKDALKFYLQRGFRVIDHAYSENPTPGAIYLELTI